MPDNNFEAEIEDKKELYGYQQGDIDAIFSRMEQVAPNYHLLYQLGVSGVIGKK